MSKGDVTFNNPISGETLIHRERKDGKRDLKTVETGLPGDRGGHSVLDENGVPVYIRDTNGNVIVDTDK